MQINVYGITVLNKVYREYQWGKYCYFNFIKEKFYLLVII